MQKQTFSRVQRYSGVAGVVVLWSFITIGMQRAQLGLVDARPISYLGVNAKSSLLFSGGLLISSLMFVIFALYVQGAFHTNRKFIMYFLVGQAAQIIAAIAPYGEANPGKLIHTIAAFTLAFSLPLLIYEFARSQPTHPSRQTFRLLLRLEQATFIVGIGLFVFTSGIAPLGEALPAVGFHIWIIVITYLAAKRQ